MIISTNSNPTLADFEILMNKTTEWLNNDATKRTEYYIKRNAQLLEEDVKNALDVNATNTPFANTIEIVSGIAFPDIVAAKLYGVEVKSSKGNNWITTGGSVKEDSRIESVERIFLTFGKLSKPIEFRSRPYEECLYDVGVTHSPRYKINMELSAGETIFDRMNTTYDDLRNTGKPIENIVRYLKSQMKEGERLWWAGGADEDDLVDVDEFKIRLANTLTASERKKITAEGLAFFPEIFGKASDKYEQFVLWLAAEYRIVSPSTRDFFSAGGRGMIVTEHDSFSDLSQVVVKVGEMKDEILSAINTAEPASLCQTWRVEEIKDDRIGQWIDLVCDHSDTFGAYSPKEVLESLFDRK